MVRVLEKEEALKILVVQLPTLYGDFINKTLLLNQKVPTESDEVKQFIDSMRDKNVLNTGKLKQHKVKFADSIEMENLDELKKRIQFHQKPGTKSNKDDDQKNKSNKDSTRKEDSTNNDNNENNKDNNNTSSTTTKIKSENQSNTILWNCIAQNYGWITAKMIRVKLLHLHILKCILKSKNLNELDKNQKYYTFETTLIIKEMTLDLYLKIIGQLSVSPELDNFLRIPDSKKRTILELPKNIRYIFFGGKMRFRRILKTTLEILIALKLIKPLNEKGEEIEVNNQHYVPQDTLCHLYNFYISVPLYDYAVRELTFIKRFNIYNFDELNNYWIQLQCVCQQRDPDIFNKNSEIKSGKKKNVSEKKSDEETTSTNADNNEIKDKEEETNQEDSKDSKENESDKSPRKRIHYSKTVFDTSHPLAYLTNIRNWQISISCTASQKLILDTYINKQKGITPLNNSALCKEIAAKIGISEIRVKSYFTRYELKYRKKKLSLINYKNGVSHKGSRRNRTRIKKSAKMGNSSIPSANSSNYGGSNHSLTNSSNKDPNELMRGRPSFRDNVLDHNSFKTGIKRKNSYSNKYTQPYNDNDLNSLPVIGDIEKYKSQYEANNKRKRPNWTAAEDEVLIHAYVISKHRADKAKLLWSPISLLFPNRTRELCCRRINVLLKNIYIQEKIRQLYIQWKSIYSIQLKKNKQRDEYLHHATILNSIDGKSATAINPVPETKEENLMKTDTALTSAITIASTTATTATTATSVTETEATTSVMEVDDTSQSITTQSTQPVTANTTIDINNSNNNINNNNFEDNSITPVSMTAPKEDDDYLDLQLNKDLSDINLKPLVDYFMKHVNIQEPTKIADKYIPLPDSIQQVQALFNIKSTVSSYNDSESCLEDILEELSSLRAKLYALYCRPLTVNAYKQEIIDNYINEDNLMMLDDEESEKIKALIKMILMTPKEQYSSTQAFSVLNSFSQEEIILAIQKAKNESMLVKVKGFTDRRVPGRGFHLSDKFLSSLSKRLPENLIYQASIYEHDLRVALNEAELPTHSPKGYVVFPPLIDGGGMASLIDLLSAGKIELEPIFKDHNKYHDIDIWIRKASHSNELNTYKRRFTDETNENANNEIEGSTSLNHENESNPSTTPRKQVKLIENKNHNDEEVKSSNKSPKKLKQTSPSETKSKEVTNDSMVENTHSEGDSNEKKSTFSPIKESHSFTNSSNDSLSLEERYKYFNVKEFIKEKLCNLKMFNYFTIYRVYQCIEETKTKGITLKKIKMKLSNYLEDTTEFDLHILLKQMMKCFVDKENNISLIISAGFKIRRYIAFKYITPWILPQHYLETEEEENSYVELNEFSSDKYKKRNPLYSPFKMWYNLDGEIVKSILRDCLETVLSAIVQNPGIYEVNIYMQM